MPKVIVNGTEVSVPDGTTILRAAEEAGHPIPYFCYHPALSIPANCRMCLCEIEGARKLEPSCYTKVRDGMVVHTESEKVLTARKAVLEFILVNHPIDCPICDQAGECWLQDHYLAHNAEESRVTTEKVSKVKVYPIGPEVMFDGERCILCTRCVRFCDEITGTSELTKVERGDLNEIRTFPGKKLDNAYSMNTADLCPVGALTTRHFRFKRRVWLLKSTPSICTGCARNCSVHLDHHRERIERYLPRFNPAVNDYWMCDRGRYTGLELREDRSLDIVVGGVTIDHWPEGIRAIIDRLRTNGADGEPRRWAMVLSPQATTESLLAAVHFAEHCLAAPLFRGGRPDGNDQDDLLIRNDRNPNNAGLDLVTKGKAVGTVEDLAHALEDGTLNAVYLMGSHVPLDEAGEERFVNALSRADLVVHQGIWRRHYAERAHLVLPATSHAEQDGTFINFEGVVQTVQQAYAPHGNSLPDWQIFGRLARHYRKPLPFSTQPEAFALLGVTALEPPEDVPAADFHRAPHGPERAIPGREVTPSALFSRYQRKVG
jgi:NADH-quinone oxidoreductase subunit G